MLASVGERKQGAPPKPTGLDFVLAGLGHGIEPRQLLRHPAAFVGGSAAPAQ